MLFAIILALFLMLVFLGFFEEYLERYRLYFCAFIAVSLFLYAGMREVGFDHDSDNYELYFISSDNPLLAFFAEPSFVLICEVSKRIWNDVHVVFLIYASLGVFLKFVAIRRLTPFIFLPLLVYVADMYVLHDLTQIRGGVASALFLLAIKPLSEGRKKRAALYMLAAALFHYSALILFPLLLFGNSDLTLKWKIALSLVFPLCVVMYIVGFDLLLSLPIPYIQSKVELYREQTDVGIVERNALIRPFLFIRLVSYYYCLLFSNTIKEYVPSINLLIKIMGVSIITYYAFTYIPVIGYRLSELYGVVEILLIPAMIYTMRPMYIGKLAVVLVAGVMFLYTYVIWDLLDFTL